MHTLVPRWIEKPSWWQGSVWYVWLDHRQAPDHHPFFDLPTARFKKRRVAHTMDSAEVEDDLHSSDPAPPPFQEPEDAAPSRQQRPPSDIFGRFIAPDREAAFVRFYINSTLLTPGFGAIIAATIVLTVPLISNGLGYRALVADTVAAFAFATVLFVLGTVLLVQHCRAKWSDSLSVERCNAVVCIAAVSSLSTGSYLWNCVPFARVAASPLSSPHGCNEPGQNIFICFQVCLIVNCRIIWLPFFFAATAVGYVLIATVPPGRYYSSISELLDIVFLAVVAGIAWSLESRARRRFLKWEETLNEVHRHRAARRRVDTILAAMVSNHVLQSFQTIASEEATTLHGSHRHPLTPDTHGEEVAQQEELSMRGRVSVKTFLLITFTSRGRLSYGARQPVDGDDDEDVATTDRMRSLPEGVMAVMYAYALSKIWTQLDEHLAVGERLAVPCLGGVYALGFGSIASGTTTRSSGSHAAQACSTACVLRDILRDMTLDVSPVMKACDVVGRERDSASEPNSPVQSPLSPGRRSPSSSPNVPRSSSGRCTSSPPMRPITEFVSWSIAVFTGPASTVFIPAQMFAVQLCGPFVDDALRRAFSATPLSSSSPHPAYGSASASDGAFVRRGPAGSCLQQQVLVCNSTLAALPQCNAQFQPLGQNRLNLLSSIDVVNSVDLAHEMMLDLYNDNASSAARSSALGTGASHRRRRELEERRRRVLRRRARSYRTAVGGGETPKLRSTSASPPAASAGGDDDATVAIDLFYLRNRLVRRSSGMLLSFSDATLEAQYRASMSRSFPRDIRPATIALGCWNLALLTMAAVLDGSRAPAAYYAIIVWCCVDAFVFAFLLPRLHMFFSCVHLVWNFGLLTIAFAIFPGSLTVSPGYLLTCWCVIFSARGVPGRITYVIDALCSLLCATLLSAVHYYVQNRIGYQMLVLYPLVRVGAQLVTSHRHECYSRGAFLDETLCLACRNGIVEETDNLKELLSRSAPKHVIPSLRSRVMNLWAVAGEGEEETVVGNTATTTHRLSQEGLMPTTTSIASPPSWVKNRRAQRVLRRFGIDICDNVVAPSRRMSRGKKEDRFTKEEEVAASSTTTSHSDSGCDPPPTPTTVPDETAALVGHRRLLSTSGPTSVAADAASTGRTIVASSSAPSMGRGGASSGDASDALEYEVRPPPPPRGAPGEGSVNHGRIGEFKWLLVLCHVPFLGAPPRESTTELQPSTDWRTVSEQLGLELIRIADEETTCATAAASIDDGSAVTSKR